jgi:hypothetical protein
MRANIVKNLANSPLLPSIFALLARILILNLYRLELIEVPYRAPLLAQICIRSRFNFSNASVSNNNLASRFTADPRTLFS